jgi:glycosyltransferase involved in cell wall biosynthesis
LAEDRDTLRRSPKKVSLPFPCPAAHSSPPRRKLRIAVLNRIFSVTGGGAERYSIALVEQLSAAHEIHVFAQEIDHQWPGVTYHRVSAPLRRPRWLNQLWYASATWWATRRGFDIVHSHENTWHGNVQTAHVLPVKYNLFNGRSGIARALRWLKVGLSPRLATYLLLERWRYAPRSGRQLVVSSQTLQTIMASAYPASAASTSVIPPGITSPALTSWPCKQVARARLGLPADGYCILFAGNDYRKKGLAALLDALALLPGDRIVAVVGNEAHRPFFETQVKALQLGGRVFFLGLLQDMTLAYQAADCLVHPTLEDTFAMVVLEALSHGLPVIVSSAAYCGIAALLTHEDNALIVDNPRDSQALARCLSRLDDDPALRERLTLGGRAFAGRYQWADVAQAQEAIYLDLVFRQPL